MQCEIKQNSITKQLKATSLRTKTEILIMVPPSIDKSTPQERQAFVLDQWRCLHNCEICGKCSILRGREAELLYSDYINGQRSYMDVTLEIRNSNY